MKNTYKSIIHTAIAATAIASAQGAETKSFSATDSLNELGIGKFSGNVQALFMERESKDDFDYDGDGRTGSLGFTLDYETGTYQGLKLGAQYVYVWDLGESGNNSDEVSSSLNTGTVNILNHLYVDYNFEHFGLKKTNLRVGRQSLSTNWASSIAPRHKASAFEGVTLHTEDIEDFVITAGHFWKFSDWSSRDNDTGFSEDFLDMQDVSNLPYSTDGVTFAEVTYNGIKDMSLTVYDFYAWDHYNTAGLRIDYDVLKTGAWTHTARTHMVVQNDVGKYHDETGNKIDSSAAQIGWQMKNGNFKIEPGIFMVAGDNSSEDLLVTTFSTDFIADYPLFDNDSGFMGGASTYYVHSSYSWGKNTLWGCVVYFDNEGDVTTGAQTDVLEANLVYGREINDRLTFKFKTGISDLNSQNSNDDMRVTDFRFFLTYAL